MIKKLLLILSLTFSVFAVEDIDNDKPEQIALTFKNKACYRDPYIKSRLEQGISQEQVLDEMSKDIAYSLEKMNLFAWGLTPIKNILSLQKEIGEVRFKRLYLDKNSHYSIEKATSSFNSETPELDKVTAMYRYASAKFYNTIDGKLSDFDLENIDFFAELLRRKCKCTSISDPDSDLEYIYVRILKYLEDECKEKPYEIFKQFEKDMPNLHKFVGERFSVDSINTLNKFHSAVQNEFNQLVHKY